MTLHGILAESARANAQKTAFHVIKDEKWTSITYAEFLTMANAAASFLKAEGVRKGGRVAIVAENRPEWCVFYLGTLMLGAVAVPVDMRLTPGEIRNILEHSGAAAVIFTRQTAKAVKEAVAGLEARLIDADSTGVEDAGGISYEETGEDDLASLLYTSGTTGAPKGAMLTHGNLCSDADAVRAVDIIVEEENVLSALPLHHTYPFMCTFVLPLLVGGSITYPKGLKGPNIVDAVKATGVTLIVAVPLMLELMRDRIFNRIGELPGPFGRAALSFIKVCGYIREKTGINPGRLLFARTLGRQFRFFACGGARLEPRVMRDMEALGFTVVEGYGLTETSPIVTFNPIDRRKPGSVGKAVKGAEIKIINPDEKGVGEVAIRGPMVMRGYYKNPEATGSAMKDGWFLSGDFGYFDGDGYLFITGRAKEVIVLSSGKNVYPEDVEKLYLKIPLIKELCVVSHEGKLHAVVVPDAGHPVEGDFEEALRREIKNLSDNIASHMRIAGYTISQEQLPRTPLGKLRRFMVGDMVKGKREKREEDPTLRDEVSQKVLRCLAPLMEGGGAVRSTDDLELDLGLDSLKRLELVASLEREFSLKLPENFPTEARTVGDVVARIKEGAPEKEEPGEKALWREPSEEEKRRAGLARRAFEWPVTVFFTLILKLIFKIFFRLESSGTGNIPGPPFIIAPNHLSNLDGLVVAAAVPLGTFRRLYFQGYYKYFEGPFKSLFGRLSHVIAIDTRGRLGNAMRLSNHVLGRGDAMCIFPEGQRSFDGELGEFKRGIGILARRLDIPVVPAKIEGTFGILPRGRWIPMPGKIRVSFGKPLRPSEVEYPEGAAGKDREQAFADSLREEVKKL